MKHHEGDPATHQTNLEVHPRVSKGIKGQQFLGPLIALEGVFHQAHRE